MKLRMIVFFAALAFFVLLAWLAGYDFDKRNFTVAYFSLCAVIFSGIAAAFP
jgi:hypothetical protein